MVILPNGHILIHGISRKHFNECYTGDLSYCFIGTLSDYEGNTII